jgi:hypothetical protein
LSGSSSGGRLLRRRRANAQGAQARGSRFLGAALLRSQVILRSGRLRAVRAALERKQPTPAQLRKQDWLLHRLTAAP